MAELTQKERLQPSLLDRLTDDEPEKKKESRDGRVLSIKKLRACVLRDMGWLLNTCNFEAVQDLEAFPYVRHSVLNYGMPDLSGKIIAAADLVYIERSLRQAIWDFEPRILRNSIKLRVTASTEEMSRHSLTFDIEGDLWAQPMPQRLYLKTIVDLELDSVEVRDLNG